MLLDARHTLILAILVLFAGRWVNRRIPWLRDYSIPEPVTGGILASLALTAVQLGTGVELQFDLAARDTLLVAFFATVGLSARISTLAAGGLMLAILDGHRGCQPRHPEHRRCRPDGGHGIAPSRGIARGIGRALGWPRYRARVGADRQRTIRDARRGGAGRCRRDVRSHRRRRARWTARPSSDRASSACRARMPRRSRLACPSNRRTSRNSTSTVCC